MIQTLILCAGSINYSNLPIGITQSNAMISVNGKPVIGWILDDLLEKGTDRATIVIREQDSRLKLFLERIYGSRTDLTIVSLSQEGSIVDSLKAGIDCVADGDGVRVILGDTLIRDPFDRTLDFVYVGEVDNTQRWCLAQIDSNSQIINYIEKQAPLNGISTKLALAGYYHLLDLDYLRRCVDICVAEGRSELSDVLRLYGHKHAITALVTNNWYDFGNIDNLVDARRRLLRPRHFNNLTIDPQLNIITKTSDKNDKLAQELHWYLSLPDDLKVLAPRIIRYDSTPTSIQITQEHYGYPTLAELSVYGELSSSVWIAILRRVFQVHDLMCQYSGTLSKKSLEDVYINKTFERVEELTAQHGLWAQLLDEPELTINGIRYLNFPLLRDRIHSTAEKLASNFQIRIIHGDFCYSNILFDVNHQIVRLIDPRGSFGENGIYGDPRYDVAKLRHSVCGQYDFIVADMFSLTQKGRSEFKTEIYSAPGADLVCKHFERLVIARGYDPEEIRFIEALLFISMTPLHQENLNRQLMMYLTGIRLLNEVFNCELS